MRRGNVWWPEKRNRSSAGAGGRVTGGSRVEVVELKGEDLASCGRCAGCVSGLGLGWVAVYTIGRRELVIGAFLHSRAWQAAQVVSAAPANLR